MFGYLLNIIITIKERLPFIWNVFEFINGKLFYYNNRMIYKSLYYYFDFFNSKSKFKIKLITISDIRSLMLLIDRLELNQKTFFEPHAFSYRSIKSLIYNKSFIMVGIFDDSKLIGYSFLRCFLNHKCFIGRLVDKDYRRQGIGNIMNEILYNTAWKSGFRIFATISKNNNLVMNAHKNNPYMKRLKDLKEDYLLVEFVKPQNKIIKKHFLNMHSFICY